MSHFWSLAVEEQFYLVWPFVVLMLSRRALMVLCLGCAGGALVLRTFFTYAVGDALSAYVLTPCRMDALLIGAYVALAVRSPGGFASVLPLARRAGFAALLVLAAIVLRYRFFSTGLPIVRTAGFTALALAFASLLVLAVTAPRCSILGRICCCPLLGSIGRIAYGLYVFHYLIHPLVRQVLPIAERHLPFTVAAVFYLVTAFVAAFALSILSWHCYEKPFLRLKDRLAPVPA